MWEESKLNRLFGMAPVQDYGPADRRHKLSTRVFCGGAAAFAPTHNSTRRSHRRRENDPGRMSQLTRPPVRRHAGDHGVAAGRGTWPALSDLHFFPTSTSLGCPFEGPHVHVVPRLNSNQARVKNEKPRVVPVTAGLVSLYEMYRADSDQCSRAQQSDFVFVNLYRPPLGEPMKLHAANELSAGKPPRRADGYSSHLPAHLRDRSSAQDRST